MANSSESEIYYLEEPIHHFLEYRPFIKLFYASITTLAGVFGVCGNFFIVFEKLRNFSSRKPFDLLLASAAAGMVALSIAQFIFMIEEVTHDFVGVFSCYTLALTFDLSMTLILMSLFTLLLLIGLRTDTTTSQELRFLGYIWIFTIIFAIPFHRIKISTSKYNDLPHNVCHFEPRRHLGIFGDILFTLKEYLLPFLMAAVPIPTLIVLSIYKGLRREFNVTEHKSLWIYSIIMATFFGVTRTLTETNKVLFMVFHIYEPHQIGIISFYLMFFSIVLNPVVYFLAERFLSCETVRNVKFKRDRETSEVLIDEEAAE
jgi:hypothetical protein